MPTTSSIFASSRRRSRRRLAAVLSIGLGILAVVVVVLLAGCGDGEGEKGAEASGQAAQAAERGFLQAMVPHHESAIEMARVALRRGEHPETKQLAGDIVEAQEGEIKTMQAIHQRLFGSPLQPSEAGHEALGLSADEAGMGHGDAAAQLADAEPFDRAFIDEMVGHHEGAVRMAEVVLDRTDDSQLRDLSETIIEDQRREIAQMKEWRTRWYGDTPDAEGGDDSDDHGGGHSG
jgi:uncharacterized protein (DUF305 family)